MKSQLDAIPENSTPLHLTLVHGTFAPNASWTKDGSYLRKKLQAAFKDQPLPGDGVRAYTNKLREEMENRRLTFTPLDWPSS